MLFSIYMFFFSCPEITCQDEDSNQYFEGATWPVGKCIECRCVQSNIHCSRELVVTSLLLTIQNTFAENCSQAECNVATYLKKNSGVCHGKYNWKKV